MLIRSLPLQVLSRGLAAMFSVFLKPKTLLFNVLLVLSKRNQTIFRCQGAFDLRFGSRKATGKPLERSGRNLKCQRTNYRFFFRLRFFELHISTLSTTRGVRVGVLNEKCNALERKLHVGPPRRDAKTKFSFSLKLARC